jgi:methionine-gamma-lyase
MMVEPPVRGSDRRGIATRAIHDPGGDREQQQIGTPLSPPLHQTSTFTFDTPDAMIDVFDGERPGFVYSRYGNPTVRIVERKLAAMEEGEFARLFASGMAAIHASLWSTLARGDLLLTGRDLYGGTTDLLTHLVPRLGASWKRIDLAEGGEFDDALEAKPAVVYFETPTNPLVRLIDGPRTVRLAREAGARVIVDNTFATPILQNPMQWGADLVVHSATKYLGGHSDVTLGVVIGRGENEKAIDTIRRSQGATPDPFAAWLLNRGVMTLPIRMRAQSAAAAAIAKAVDHSPGVERVYYPGLDGHPGHEIAVRQMRDFGAILALDLTGGREGAVRFMRGLRIIKLGASLGGVESLATHPSTSSHRTLSAAEREAIGIRDGLVRISVGLEDVEDLLADLRDALRGSEERIR